jgi:hypothetical protein
MSAREQISLHLAPRGEILPLSSSRACGGQAFKKLDRKNQI